VWHCRINSLLLGKSRSRNQREAGIISRDLWRATVKKISSWEEHVAPHHRADRLARLTDQSLPSPHIGHATESLLSRETGSQQVGEQIVRKGIHTSCSTLFNPVPGMSQNY